MFIFNYIYFLLYIVPVWKSEDNFWQLFSPSTTWVPGINLIHVLSLSNKYVKLLSHLTKPSTLPFKELMVYFPKYLKMFYLSLSNVWFQEIVFTFNSLTIASLVELVLQCFNLHSWWDWSSFHVLSGSLWEWLWAVYCKPMQTHGDLKTFQINAWLKFR